MRPTFLAVVLLAICALGLSCMSPKKTLAPSASLRIASWNIYAGTTDMEGIERTIRNVDADVICLQETIKRHQTWIQEHLTDLYPYQSYYVGRVDNGPTILSKRPLRNVKYRPSTWGLNGYSYAEIEYDGQVVQFVNLHLQPTWLNHGRSPAGLFKSVVDQERIQAREVAEMWNESPRKEPAIVMGDFNCLAGMQAYRYMTEHGFKDALAEVIGRPAAQPTIRHEWKGLDTSLCIDFIFTTADIQAREGGTRFGHPSDHNLVWAEVVFSPVPAH